LLEETGFNDVAVDKQLATVITQNADFGSKVSAIREYNKLKQRITERIDHTSGGKAFNFTVMSFKDAKPDDTV
jgi:hypothetical protein